MVICIDFMFLGSGVLVKLYNKMVNSYIEKQNNNLINPFEFFFAINVNKIFSIL